MLIIVSIYGIATAKFRPTILQHVKISFYMSLNTLSGLLLIMFYSKKAGLRCLLMDPWIVQFFLGDFRPLARDTHGNVLDVVSTQVSPSYLEDFLFNHNIFLLGIVEEVPQKTSRRFI